MNERIKKLADEAHEFAHDTIEYGQDFGEIWNQKFAELIINQCAALCINEGRAHAQWFGSHCSITVKEHFGVEE